MSSASRGISKKLLIRVLSVYFVLTILVTLGQVAAEYFSAQSHIKNELQTLKNTFGASLTRAIWELNTPQVNANADGLMELPIIVGVQIRDEKAKLIASRGLVSKELLPLASTGNFFESEMGLFGYQFPLIFEFSGRATQVGDVTLYSNTDTIISRIEVSLMFLVGNAFVKSAFLIFLFFRYFRIMLTDPLKELSHQIRELDFNHLESSKLHLHSAQEDEIHLLQAAYNQLIDNLIVSKADVNSAQEQLRQANQQLDQQNLSLEQEVAQKTASLSKIMLNLEQQKDQLLSNEYALKSEIGQRKLAEESLQEQNKTLAESMVKLEQAKDRLVESERLASLGGLVAGIAHDVNTPIGIGVTTSSFMQTKLKSLREGFENKSLNANQLAGYIEDFEQSTELMMKNMQRASDLINSFKQVAVDQTSEAVRDFYLKSYIDEVIASLAPKLRGTQHKVELECPEDLRIRSAPGIIAQIITNMIMNSLIHGFEDKVEGHIKIVIQEKDGHVQLNYQDDGKGISPEDLSKLFDAFYTTKRNQGGSGLGTHIIYNLVKRSLGGSIQVESDINQGLKYSVQFPTQPLSDTQLS